jgi:hypothetical protein
LAYWSKGANFDTADNWINEAFAEYLRLMAAHEYFVQAVCDEMLACFESMLGE